MLRASFKKGRDEALVRFGVKVAATTLPAARIVPKGSGVHGPVATPAPMPTAQAVASPTLGERARTALSGAGETASRFMRPIGKGLGLAALGGLGALAYGLHRQNVTDRENYPLVYAPMQGSYLG